MFKFLLGVVAGISLGILFAPKEGKKLRKELASSEDKFKTFGKILLSSSRDASEEIKKIISSKEFQSYIKDGKEKANEAIDFLAEKGKKLSLRAQDELNDIIEMAQKEISVQKKVAKKKIAKAKKVVKKKVDTAKKTAKKKVEKTKKTIKKTASKAKKTIKKKLG